MKQVLHRKIEHNFRYLEGRGIVLLIVLKGGDKWHFSRVDSIDLESAGMLEVKGAVKPRPLKRAVSCTVRLTKTSLREVWLNSVLIRYKGGKIAQRIRRDVP